MNEHKMVGELGSFRCNHGLRAGLGECGFCKPKRPLGTRKITLDNGTEITARKSMYRKRTADKVEFVGKRMVIYQYAQDAIDTDKEVMIGTYRRNLVRITKQTDLDQKWLVVRGRIGKELKETIEYHDK
jgi:hypothetical protein